MPFFAALTAVLYPTNFLLNIFISTGSLGSWWIEFFLIAHYWLAAFGMYFLCRNELKQSGWAALLAGVTFGFSGFMISHEMYASMIFQFAWLPWVCFAMMRGARTHRIQWFIFGGLILGVSLFAGHPQIALYTYFALGMLAVTMMCREWNDTKNIKNVALLALDSLVLAVIAACVCAIQYLPAIELASLAERSETSYEFAATNSLQWGQLLTLLIPKYFGTQQEAFFGTLHTAALPSLPYWLGANGFWETCCYTGILPLMLAGIGAYRGQDAPHRRYLLILAGFALAFALGDNFIVFPLFYHIPVFAIFRCPVRIMFLFAFAVAIFAGCGFDVIAKERMNLKRADKFPFKWLLGGLAFGLFLIFAGSSIFDNMPLNLIDKVNARVWIFCFFWAASIVAIWMLRNRIVRASVVFASIVLFTSADLLFFGSGYNDGTNSPDNFFNKCPSNIKQMEYASQNDLFRVRMGAPIRYMALARNQGMINHLFLIEGYSPFILQRHQPQMFFSRDAWEDVMNVRYITWIDSASNSYKLLERQDYLPRACMFYQARVTDDSGVIRGLTVPYDYRHILYLEKKPGVALPDTSVHPVSNVRVTNYTPNEIRIAVETSENGILFTSEICYPAWQAYVDGVPAEILRANSCLRSVALTKGTHEVVFRYESKTMILTCSGQMKLGAFSIRPDIISPHGDIRGRRRTRGSTSQHQIEICRTGRARQFDMIFLADQQYVRPGASRRGLLSVGAVCRSVRAPDAAFGHLDGDQPDRVGRHGDDKLLEPYHIARKFASLDQYQQRQSRVRTW